MYKGVKTCVVIPCYDAQDTIQGVIESLPEWVDQIIAVDDCSEDGTAQLLATLCEPRLIILTHTINRGVGGAMKTGYNEGLKGNAEIFIKVDSDGQMDPSQIWRLLEPILRRQANFTKGNRFLHLKQLKSMPSQRRFGNVLMSFLSKTATGYWNIFDPANGFTAIDRSALEALDFDRLAEGYYFETSMLAALYEVRAPVCDVSIPARYQGEISHLSETQIALEFSFRLLGTFFHRMKSTYFMQDFNAVSVFIIAGLISSLFGIVWGAVQWGIASRAGVTASTGTVMIAVLPIMLGIQLLLQAIVLDVQSVPKDFVDEKSPYSHE